LEEYLANGNFHQISEHVKISYILDIEIKWNDKIIQLNFRALDLNNKEIIMTK